MVAEEEGEEGREPKGIRAPARVSRQEREVHERTHTPYRPWCKYCVRARGRNTAHRKSDQEEVAEDELKVPRISMDYFFMSEEDQAANENPLLVMLDEETGDKYARAVGHKGLGVAHERDWVIKDMSAELKAWGHPGGDGNSLILKSDGESAIIAVKDALGRFHGGRMIPEKPPKGESQSNGAVEEAGKTIREFTVVLKEQLEDKANMKVSSDDVIVQWMVRWSAMMVSRFLVGKDGRTSYERRRGRKCKIPVVAFGEKIWYKELREGKQKKDKFTSEWQEGIWLGHARSSNEAIVGTRKGVVRAYSIKRQPEDERWDRGLIKDLKGTPQQPNPLKPGMNIPIKVSFDPPRQEIPMPSEPLREEKAPRRMKITAAMVEKYGYTDGCDACRNKRAGVQSSKGHNEVCRERIRKAMAEDEDGGKRLRQEEERTNRWLAEQLEKADKENKDVKHDGEEGVKDIADRGRRKRRGVRAGRAGREGGIGPG